MSTTFGVNIDKGTHRETKPVALRYGKRERKVGIKWIDPLYRLIKPNTPVIPMDNTPQGVETIQDLLNLEGG